MDKVAEFINTRCYRQALARLCRLALTCEAHTGHLPAIKSWEKRHDQDPETLDGARERISLIDDGDSPQPANLKTEEVADDPILWLQAIDEHLNARSPSALLRYLQSSHAIINDGDEEVWVIPEIALTPCGKFSTQFENLGFWLKHHKIIPKNNSESIPIAVEGIPRSYNDWLSEVLASETIRIAVAHFEDSVIPIVTPREPHHFICEQLSDETKRSSSLMALIRKAKKEGIHVLVMPELTVTPELREAVTDEMFLHFRQHGKNHDLSIPIIVLGSFHEQTNGQWRNHSCGVSGLDGQALFSADKRKSVTYQERAEWIECAPTPFTCLTTPIGLMAITICKDLFDAGAPSTATLLNNLPLDWLLVPSMSKEIKLHMEKAKSLHNTLGTLVAVANQEMPGDPPLGGFIHDDTCEESNGELHIVEVQNRWIDTLPFD